MRHDDVDGVEVAPAMEAPGEVGFGVGGGVEGVTDRAEETETAVEGFIVDMEGIRDEGDDLDAVAELAQVVFGEGCGHGRLRVG